MFRNGIRLSVIMFKGTQQEKPCRTHGPTALFRLDENRSINLQQDFPMSTLVRGVIGSPAYPSKIKYGQLHGFVSANI